MLGKDFEQGGFGDLSLMLSPQSLNGLVLCPYFTRKGPCLPIAWVNMQDIVAMSKLVLLAEITSHFSYA
jgi:hypothetical protein